MTIAVIVCLATEDCCFVDGAEYLGVAVGAVEGEEQEEEEERERQFMLRHVLLGLNIFVVSGRERFERRLILTVNKRLWASKLKTILRT